MAVKKSHTGPRRNRFGDRSLKVLGQKASVAVDQAVAGLGKNQFRQECRGSRLSLARIPKREAEVFLVVDAKQVPRRLSVNLAGERDAVRDKLHCVSNKWRT